MLNPLEVQSSHEPEIAVDGLEKPARLSDETWKLYSSRVASALTDARTTRISRPPIDLADRRNVPMRMRFSPCDLFVMCRLELSLSLALPHGNASGTHRLRNVRWGDKTVSLRESGWAHKLIGPVPSDGRPGVTPTRGDCGFCGMIGEPDGIPEESPERI